MYDVVDGSSLPQFVSLAESQQLHRSVYHARASLVATPTSPHTSMMSRSTCQVHVLTAQACRDCPAGHNDHHDGLLHASSQCTPERCRLAFLCDLRPQRASIML